MNRKTLIIISIGIIIAGLFLAGLVFFKKDQGGGVLDNNKTETRQIVPPKPEPRKISEEEKVKIMAENFVSVYYSYEWRNFGNIESLKDKMTDELWEEKSRWIEFEKEKFKSQPKRYVIFSGISQKASVVFMEEKKAKIKIELDQFETRGASIYISDVLTQVNEFGEEKPISPATKTQKKILLELVKIDDEWRVDKIGN